jgi:SAM-dependent methyltransferase
VLKKIKKYKSSGKLLDVGCATGDFLLEAKKFNYEVEGLELSKWSAKIAESYGLKIHRQTLESLASKYPKKYDVISLWGVIEHFEFPKDEMIFLNKLLKPGGLLVLWTGDVDGFISRLLRRKWWYWQGQHIQYFTGSSLNRLGEAHGFKHLSTFVYPVAVTWDQISNSLNRYKFKNIISVFIRPFFILKPIWYLRIPGEMFWIANKREETR